MEESRAKARWWFVGLWVGSALVGGILHARSFTQAHDEGDEVVYLALAKRMSWTLGDYSTRDIPGVRDFPDAIYRAPLFHQPPLWPLILKVGRLLGDPISFGLLFQNASLGLVGFYAARWLKRTGEPPGWALISFAGLTLCPLLLSSTMLLHTDALLGIYLTCGILAYIEALENPTAWRILIASLLLVMAFNLRYNALLSLPLILALPVYHASMKDSTDSRRFPRWLAPLIVVAVVATVGLGHYYRVYATYGTILPSQIVRPDASIAQFSGYMKIVANRTPIRMLTLLFLTFPVWILFLTPWPYQAILHGVRQRSWGPVPLVIFLALMIAEFPFSYRQMRYFAAETPWFYLGMPWLIRNLSGVGRGVCVGLAAATAFSLAITGFVRTVINPLDALEIVPGIYYYLPQLLPRYQ